MPSTESAALKTHFQSMTDRMAANPAMDLLTLRTMLEELHERAAEPTAVTSISTAATSVVLKLRQDGAPLPAAIVGGRGREEGEQSSAIRRVPSA